MSHAGYWDHFLALVSSTQVPWAEGKDDTDEYQKKKYYDSLRLDGRQCVAYDLYCHLRSPERCTPLVAYLVERLYLWLRSSPPSCAHVCAHVCACAHFVSVCAKCAGVQGRAGPVAGAHACRGCPILSILSRHAVGKRGGVVSTGAHACFPQPPPQVPLCLKVLCCGSHPVLGGLWITLWMEWSIGRWSRSLGFALAEFGVTLIGLALVEWCAGSRSPG